MGMKITGFREFENELNKLQKRAEKLAREKSVSFDKLFTKEFIQQYTSSQTLQDLYDNSGFKINSQEDFESIPDDQWDNYIRKVTQFNDWESMLGKASEEYIAKRLGF